MKEKKIYPYMSIGTGIIFFVLLVMIDQLTKKWAVLFLKGQDPVILIKNVFQLYYLENHGAAFGILEGKSAVFICITLIVCPDSISAEVSHSAHFYSIDCCRGSGKFYRPDYTALCSRFFLFLPD